MGLRRARFGQLLGPVRKQGFLRSEEARRELHAEAVDCRHEAEVTTHLLRRGSPRSHTDALIHCA